MSLLSLHFCRQARESFKHMHCRNDSNWVSSFQKRWIMNTVTWLILLLIVVCVIADLYYIATHGIDTCGGSCDHCTGQCKWIGDINKAKKAIARKKRIRAFLHLTKWIYFVFFIQRILFLQIYNRYICNIWDFDTNKWFCRKIIYLWKCIH